MSICRTIRKIDRFVAEDARGGRFGVDVFAEVVEHRGFFRVRREVGDPSYHLANGVVLEPQDDGQLVNREHGHALRPVTAPTRLPASLQPPALAAAARALHHAVPA